MQVIATQEGHFGGRLYQPGDTFECPDETWWGAWTQPVDPVQKEKWEAKYAEHRKAMRPVSPAGTIPTTVFLKEIPQVKARSLPPGSVQVPTPPAAPVKEASTAKK